jgi:hypothetical protein
MRALATASRRSAPLHAALLLVGALVLGCGDDESDGASTSSTAGAGGAATECPPGQTPQADATCLPAGRQPSGCSAGELSIDGGCRAAGIPADACANGFEPDAGGCRALLPETMCPPGRMAIPGETRCREVAPCGDGTWGDIPVDAATEHVDAGYSGADGDGTAQKPWTQIQQAVDAAQAGDVIAVAAGSYTEDVAIEGKQVTLWGRCPSLVEISGSVAAAAAMVISSGSDGTTIRGVSIRGATGGLAASGVLDISIEEAVIHDTGGLGIYVDDYLGASRLSMRGVLVDRATDLGVAILSAEAIIEDSVVRDTLPSTAGTAGRGIDAEQLLGSTRYSSVVVRRSVVEDNGDIGIYASDTQLVVEGSVVRDTRPDDGAAVGGRGINVEEAIGGAATLELRGSVIDGNHDVGVFVGGSHAQIETTVVRGTRPRAEDAKSGRGLSIAERLDGAPSSVVVRSSVFEDNHNGGIFAAASELTVEGSIVRRTLPEAASGARGYGIDAQDGFIVVEPSRLIVTGSLIEANSSAAIRISGSEGEIEGCLLRDTQPETDGGFGRGLLVQSGVDTGAASTVTVRASVIARSHEVGLGVLGSDVTVEGSIISETLPRASDGKLGNGVQVQPDEATLTPGRVVLRHCVIDKNRYVGVFVAAARAVLEHTLVRDTEPRTSDGSFGDGVAAVSISGFEAASAAIVDSRIERSARVGVASFGGAVDLAGTVLECNGIDLAAEHNGDFSPELADGENNRCGCEAETRECRVISSMLAPPEPLD